MANLLHGGSFFPVNALDQIDYKQTPHNNIQHHGLEEGARDTLCWINCRTHSADSKNFVQ